MISSAAREVVPVDTIPITSRRAVAVGEVQRLIEILISGVLLTRILLLNAIRAVDKSVVLNSVIRPAVNLNEAVTTMLSGVVFDGDVLRGWLVARVAVNENGTIESTNAIEVIVGDVVITSGAPISNTLDVDEILECQVTNRGSRGVVVHSSKLAPKERVVVGAVELEHRHVRGGRINKRKGALLVKAVATTYVTIRRHPYCAN